MGVHFCDMLKTISVSDGFDAVWVFIAARFLSTKLHIVTHTQVVYTCYKLQTTTNK
jgi:hypothetical protein